MTTYFYTSDGEHLSQFNICLSGAIDASQAIRDNTTAPAHHDTQQSWLNRMLDLLRCGDTLIVARLDGLGNDPHAISEAIRLLARHGIRLWVDQIGTVDLASPEGDAVIRTLDAIAEMSTHAVMSHPGKGPLKNCRQDAKTADMLRNTIVTEYSLGESITSIARRYGVPRAKIAQIVRPAVRHESSLPIAFGD